MSEHRIRISQRGFAAVKDGRKKAIVRAHKGVQVDDVIHLTEWNVGEECYTGETYKVRVTDQYLIPEKLTPDVRLAVLSIQPDWMTEEEKAAINDARRLLDQQGQEEFLHGIK